MALILLVDPSEMARRAMRGILARAGHRLAVADSEADAWEFIRKVIKVDLVFSEQKFPNGSGISLVQRLKADCLLKHLPIVIYTERTDRETVKRALDLHVQNYLVKPYHDIDIFTEIKRATLQPWRSRHFEEEKSFCKLMGLTPEALHKQMEGLQTSLEVAQPELKREGELKLDKKIAERAAALAADAEAAGAWGIVDCLNELTARASADDWDGYLTAVEQIAFAARFIFSHLNPQLTPMEFLSDDEQHALQEEEARNHWSKAPMERRCPVVDWPRLQREVEAMAGVPVIDTAAAAFQMAATGHPSCLSPLMDIVEKDPGLAAQMLIAANHVKRSQESDPSPVEEPRLAVGLLGEIRLAAQAASLVIAEERMMQLPPVFDWPRFWKFQIGVARMARYTCHYLELYSMESVAGVAGLLHDLGKLVLLRLHPFALQAILGHARDQQVSLREAERLFLGCTTAELGAHFATKHGLPPRYASVIRWIDSPEEAEADAPLVAVVSLARDLCRQNNLGADGEMKREHAVPIEKTPEWRILSGSTFPSFNLRKFELQVHSDCRELKLELNGRLGIRAVA
ncbi:MAG: HDOD domain-containing protein [Verrucomicrobia bacterium]|nr:HDOD domain-containing protein [Verrucomicrobiota bacterium]